LRTSAAMEGGLLAHDEETELTALVGQPGSLRHSQTGEVWQQTAHKSCRWRAVAGVVGVLATVGVVALAFPWAAVPVSLVSGPLSKGVVGLAASTIEGERVFEWQVVEPLGVTVRVANSVYSRKLAVMPHRRVVCGRVSGDWLTLVGQPGFMLYKTGHRQLLKKLETTQTVEQCQMRVQMSQITTTATALTTTMTASFVTTTTLTVTIQTTSRASMAPTTTTPTATEIASATTTTTTGIAATTRDVPNAIVVDSLWNFSSLHHPSPSNLSSTSPQAKTNELQSTSTEEGTPDRSSSSAAASSDLAVNASPVKGDSSMESSTSKPSIKLIERGSTASANEGKAVSKAASTSSVPDLMIEEEPSQLEWQVVADGQVHVRLAKRPGAAVSGLVPQRGIFLGTREGNWIKLFRRAGFLMVDNGSGTVRAVQRAISYSWLPEGSTCTEYGKFPIMDASVCEAAAFTLRLASTYTRLRSQSPMPEAGCYSDSSGVLWHASEISPLMASKRHSLRPLCASKSHLASGDLARG